MKNKSILIFALFLLAVPLAYPENEIRIANKTHLSDYDGIFIPPSTILIDESSPFYRELLVHEYVHAVCYTLFDDADSSHTRCFTSDYNEGKAII